MPRAGYNGHAPEPPERFAELDAVEASSRPPVRRLPSSTAQEIYITVPAATVFNAEPLVAPGCATLLNGGPKAGKSSLVVAMIAAILDGEEFLGRPTLRTPVLLLTEEGRTTFRHLLQRANLRSPDLHVVHYGDTLHLDGWAEVMRLALLLALEKGVGLVVIDTAAVWGGYAGDGENSAGEVNAAYAHIRPLLAAGIAVLLIGHTRKSGGSVIDAGRGSNAASANVDIVASLTRPEVRGRTPENARWRVLEVIGRLDGLPDEPMLLTRDLDGHYSVVEKDSTGQTGSDMRGRVLHAIGGSARSLTSAEVRAMVKGRNELVVEVLEALVVEGVIAVRGEGGRKDPRRYSVPTHSSPAERIGNASGTHEAQPPRDAFPRSQPLRGGTRNASEGDDDGV